MGALRNRENYRPKGLGASDFAAISLRLSRSRVNQDGKRVAYRKLVCDLKEVTEFPAPFKPRLQLLAVESTFNWYRLVDGLRAPDNPIDLANPAKIEECSGLKHSSDKNAARGPEFFGIE